MAAVSVDGGRIMTRAEAGRGVHEQAWKETKNACLMTMSSATSQDDPHPQLPTCFSDQALRRKTGARDACRRRRARPRKARKHPPRIFGEKPDGRRQVVRRREPSRHDSTPRRAELASRATGADLPQQHGIERRVRPAGGWRSATPRLLSSAHGARSSAMAKPGTGRSRQRHFPDFVAITDFVHPLGYVYDAAKVLAPADRLAASPRAATACWQGRVADFLHGTAALASRASHAAGGRNCPTTIRALSSSKHASPTWRTTSANELSRVSPPGLPVSSSMIESLIKEINYRVKGTEKFWNRPEGAEQILQVRAAALGDDDRLSQWILNRPGSFYHRGTPSPPLQPPGKNNWSNAPTRVALTAGLSPAGWSSHGRLRPLPLTDGRISYTTTELIAPVCV